MKIGILWAYLKKEITELSRNRILLLVYIIPTMILLLFGYGIRIEVTRARTLIIDRDNSHLSQKLISTLEHSKYFNAHLLAISDKKALHRIKLAKSDIIIILPPSFERNLLHRNKAEIGIFIDGSYPMRALMMQSYIEGAIFHLAQHLFPHQPPITIEYRALFNQSMRDENAIVPGLIGLVLLVAPALLAALLIVKEKELGTIFNFYASSLTKGQFLIAKLTPVFLLHSLNIFILFLWATYLFKVPFRGSFALYWGVSEIYVLISVGIGLLVSIITNRQIVAVVLTVIITLIPGFLYSGILMPISSMRGESAIEAHLVPIMYYNHIIYDAFLIGEGLHSSINRLYILVLALYACLLLFLGWMLLKKELR